MDIRVSLLLATILLTMKISESSSGSVLTLVHDLVQNNIAGVPSIHQQTEWDFDPKQGKERRARFESSNGRYGQDLIDRLGMGMGYKGPWGTRVSKQLKPDLRYV